MSIEKFETAIHVEIDKAALTTLFPDPKTIEGIAVFIDQKRAMEISYVGPELLRLLQLIKSHYPLRFGFFETITETIETDFINIDGHWYRLRPNETHWNVIVETTSGEEAHRKRVSVVKQALIDKNIPIVGGQCEVTIKEIC